VRGIPASERIRSGHFASGIWTKRSAGGKGASGGPNVDYKEVLDEADFAVFSCLRELRKVHFGPMIEKYRVPGAI
jgi:hypothetical protein